MIGAPRARRLFIIAALVVVGASALLAVVFPYGADSPYPVVWYKRVPGFVAVLGFVGCMLIVPAVKTFAKKVLQRPDEYYAAFEGRLAELTGPPPGESLADPSAPSEEGATAADPLIGDDTPEGQEEVLPPRARVKEGGSHG